MRKRVITIAYIMAVLIILCACDIDIPDYVEDEFDYTSIDLNNLDLTEANNVIASLDISAPGTNIQGNEFAVVDYSNISKGYVVVNYLQQTDQKIKVQIKGPNETYTYPFTPTVWSALPLTDGNGKYTVAVYSNIVDSKYALVFSVDINVELESEFEPFLRPNMYVDYTTAPKALTVARILTQDRETVVEKVSAIYKYITYNITYDNNLARSVKSGYIPDIDATLDKQSGICFDYAALAAGMFRSLGIPCKLVVGYAGEAYHAWISVYSPDEGWLDDIIYFDGNKWQLLDPTFAAADDLSASLIGNGSNYSAKYYY